MTRILVTGVSGLLGINLALEAAKQHEVIGVLHQNTLHDHGFETIQADLLDLDAPAYVMDQAKPDWVINCAALANLDYCEQQPELARRLNAELPGRLAIETVKRGIRFLHVSTDAVFNGEKGNYREDDSPAPISVYARTKRLAELAVKSANPQSLIVRSNFFGWSVSGERSLAEFFYNNLLAGNPVSGFTDRLFCPLLANNLAAILLNMLKNKLRGIFHVASSDHVSKYEFGVAIANRFGLETSLIQPASANSTAAAAPRAANLTLNTSKIAKVLKSRMPTVGTGIERLAQLDQSGYRAKLRALAAAPEAIS